MEDDFNKDDEFMDFVRSIGEQIIYLRNLAVVQYTPLVDELCRRDAELNEVERMLDYLLDFADDNRILKLYKRVCRTFFYTYPDSIAFYVMSIASNTIEKA